MHITLQQSLIRQRFEIVCPSCEVRQRENNLESNQNKSDKTKHLTFSLKNKSLYHDIPIIFLNTNPTIKGQKASSARQ